MAAFFFLRIAGAHAEIVDLQDKFTDVPANGRTGANTEDGATVEASRAAELSSPFRIRIPNATDVALQNSAMFAQLKELAESPAFSKAALTFHETCPRGVKPCSATSCHVPGFGTGVIDLLKITEGRSPHGKDGAAVWADIYRELSVAPAAVRLASGLHFSVTTHIAAFYTSIFWWHVSCPAYLHDRDSPERRANFRLLFSLLRAALVRLLSQPSEASPEVLDLATNIARFDESHFLHPDYSPASSPTSLAEHSHDSLRKYLSENLKKLKKFKKFKKGVATSEFKNQQSSAEQSNGLGEVPESHLASQQYVAIAEEFVTPLSQAIQYLACLSCQKCRLWGTIQLKGMRAAIRAVHGAELSEAEIFFLVNALRRLSVSEVESRRLAGLPRHSWRFLLIHAQVLLLATGGALAGVAVALRWRRLVRRRCYAAKDFKAL